MKERKAKHTAAQAQATRRSAQPTFWLVWRDGYNSTPHHKHQSVREAELEAERLAVLFPGEKFYVLPASRYAVASINPVAWAADEIKTVPKDEGVPF